MDRRKREAIEAHVSQVVADVQSRALGFAPGVVQPEGFVYARLTDALDAVKKLVPEAEKSVRDYCIEVGIRDPTVIKKYVYDALSLIGQSGLGLAGLHQGVNPGTAHRESLRFETDVELIAAGALGRAKIAIEKQRPHDPTYFDQIVRRVKNHRVGAWILVAAVVIGGVTVSATVKEIGVYVWHKIRSTPATSPAQPASAVAPRASSVDARPPG